MNDEMRPDRADLPTVVLDRLDRIRERFEAVQAGGARPRIEDYLGGDDAHRSALLRDLLASELDARRRRGERPEPPEYRGRFGAPGDSPAIEAAFAATSVRPTVDLPGAAPADATLAVTVSGDFFPGPLIEHRRRLRNPMLTKNPPPPPSPRQPRHAL